MYGDEREPEAGNRRDEQLHAAHVAAVTGTTDPHYARAIEEFAMASINEVVCGVETPATIRQAQMLPEWPKWYAACRADHLAGKEMHSRCDTLLAAAGIDLSTDRTLGRDLGYLMHRAVARSPEPG